MSERTSMDAHNTRLPAIPDEDHDFTPDLARKIIAQYQTLVATLTAERDEARARAVKVRWEGDRAWVGPYMAGMIYNNYGRDSKWRCTTVAGFIKYHSTEAEARAAVEDAVRKMMAPG